jgi:hypothetical protein
MFRISSTELRMLGITLEEGREFDSALLELKPARFRVLRLTEHGADLERIAWLEDALSRTCSTS